MEDNNQNSKKKNPFIAIVAVLLVISIGCTLCGYLNKDKNKKEPVTNKEVMELENVAGTQDGNIRYELFINAVFANK